MKPEDEPSARGIDRLAGEQLRMLAIREHLELREEARVVVEDPVHRSREQVPGPVGDHEQGSLDEVHGPPPCGRAVGGAGAPHVRGDSDPGEAKRGGFGRDCLRLEDPLVAGQHRLRGEWRSHASAA